MTKDDLIRELRLDGIVRGTKPCYFTLKKNPGNVYTGKTANYIVALSNGSLLFNKMSIFDKLKKSGHFKVDLKDIKEYALVEQKMFSVLYLYFDDKSFIPLVYQNQNRFNSTTQRNVVGLVEEFEKLGIKKIR